MASFHKRCKYRPLLTKHQQTGALVTVTAKVAEAGYLGERPTVTLELTVRSNMTKPDPELTFSQALLGIQVLALDHEGLEVLDYEPKYTPPKRSYTFSAKATHAKAKADAVQHGENKAYAVSTSLALSKSTLFSISGTKTNTYSYLKVSGATDTETKEEGVSVTLDHQEAWQALDTQDVLHIWNSAEGEFTSRENPRKGISWTFRLLHGDLLQDACATGQLQKTITLKLLLPKGDSKGTLSFHIFHQFAGTFQPPPKLEATVGRLEAVVSSLLGWSRQAQGAGFAAAGQMFYDLWAELNDDSVHSSYGRYLRRQMLEELKMERPKAFPGQFIAVDVICTAAWGVSIDKVRLETPPPSGTEFADLSKVGKEQPLAYTEDPDKALRELLLISMDNVHRLQQCLDPATKDPPWGHRFPNTMKDQEKSNWAGYYLKALEMIQSECHCLKNYACPGPDPKDGKCLSP